MTAAAGIKVLIGHAKRAARERAGADEALYADALLAQARAMRTAAAHLDEEAIKAKLALREALQKQRMLNDRLDALGAARETARTKRAEEKLPGFKPYYVDGD